MAIETHIFDHLSLRMRRWIMVFLSVVLAGCVVSQAKATSYVFPKFSTPQIIQESILFTSPDGRRLICIRTDGQKQWERGFAEPVNFFSGPGAVPLIQIGRDVSRIEVESGTFHSLFTVEDENDLAGYSIDLAQYISTERRFGHRQFKLLDAQGLPRWRSKETERVVGAGEDTMVVYEVERIPTDMGYRFGKSTLVAYDRKTCAVKWRAPQPDEFPAPYFPALVRPPCIIYTDTDKSISVLDLESGRLLRRQVLELPKYGRIDDIQFTEGRLVWLTSHFPSGNYDDTAHDLNFCSIPDLDPKKTVTLKLIEIAKVSFEEGFIVSDALYRTACFRPDGTKLWERFQMERTPARQGLIYFSDYFEQTARLGSVDMATGKETILYRESLNAPKRYPPTRPRMTK